MANFFDFPANILGHISALLLGDYQRNDKGNVVRDENGHAVTGSFYGILGLFLGSVIFLAQALTRLGLMTTHAIKETKQTLNTAFWLALILGGAAALTVACWPAALALVVNYSVLGYSIATLVGSEFAAQVLGTGVVAAIASSASIFSLSALVHGACHLFACCCGPRNKQQAEFIEQESHATTSSHDKLRGLGASSSTRQSKSASVEVIEYPTRNPRFTLVSSSRPAPKPADDIDEASVVSGNVSPA